LDQQVEQELAILSDGEGLRERLFHALQRRSDVPVAVGVAFGGRLNCAAIGMESDDESPQGISMLAGCITKVLTATMVTDMVHEGAFGMDCPVSELLKMREPDAAVLSGISVRQLLEHTHGLDDSLVTRLPRSADGWIDGNELCAQLAASGTLAKPGLLHNYGNAGPWLAAAVLERTLGERYVDILNQRILVPMRMGTGQVRERESICPATGGELRTSVEGLLRFLLREPLSDHTGSPPVGGSPSEGADVTPLPGWSSQEHGIRLGWKHYGSAWFGHNSILPRASALARVLRSRGLAIVMNSASQSVSSILARLFGTTLPSLAALRIPRPLTSAEAAALDTTPFIGTYANGALTISISRSKPGALQLQAFARKSSKASREPLVKATLRPARDNVFFTIPAHAELFPFVQFIVAKPGGSRFLWNGRSVWPALSAQDSSALESFDQ
jgi:hypothetical protein